jgi:hypothetical protein
MARGGAGQLDSVFLLERRMRNDGVGEDFMDAVAGALEEGR